MVSSEDLKRKGGVHVQVPSLGHHQAFVSYNMGLFTRLPSDMAVDYPHRDRFEVLEK